MISNYKIIVFCTTPTKLSQIIHTFRFGFESTESPPNLFGPESDVKRVDAIDAEIRASGITRNDEKELLTELSKTTDNCDFSNENEEESPSSDEEIDSENEEAESKEELNDESSIPEDLDSLRRLVDDSTSEALFPEKANKEKESSIEKFTETNVEDSISSLRLTNQKDDVHLNAEEDEKSHMSTPSVRKTSRYAPSSVASTIAPEVIKERVKASLEKRKKNQQMKRIRTKGDTSGITRQRNENRNEIKTSTDAFWMD